MIIVGSVRPGRVGLPIAEWVRSQVEERTQWDVDWVDLQELALPFMDEPNHPRLRQYTHPHTFAWSERVDAADVVILVTPEYNYGASPALRNAFDYLHQEWWRKPVGFVSYGGMSSGTRGVVSMLPALTALGMVRAGANVEIAFPATMISDGVFTPTEKESAIIGRMLIDLAELAETLRPLQNR
jgi:NAD(P)H-dependent FMN reductase